MGVGHRQHHRRGSVFAVAAAFIALGAIVKYVVPGRRLKDNGIPSSTLLLGGLLASSASS